MKEKFISVIVVLYYSSQHLSRLLKNIYDVLPQAGEVILVDNSNEDLSHFSSDIVRIIQPGTNLGYGGAINLGVRYAQYNNLLVMNPDIYLESYQFNDSDVGDDQYIISGMTREMTRVPCFPRLWSDLVRLGLCNISQVFRPLRQLLPSTPLTLDKKIQPVHWVCGCLLITNKKTLEHISGFDENYFLFYEEVDLCQRAAGLGILVGITSTIIYTNYYGTSSSTDVSEIKIKAELESFMRYHRIYSPGIITEFSFFLLKVWIGSIAIGLKGLLLLFSKKKIENKAKQYFLYYQTLKPFTNMMENFR